MRRLLSLALAGAALLFSPAALAHGLLMKLEREGDAIAGTLYYSNGQRAGGEWIELFDEARPGAAVQTIRTQGDGSFRLHGEQGHRYRVRASGEEGHEITMTIAFDGAQARGKMVGGPQEEGAAPSEAEAVPAWAVLGGLLALSAIPALWLRRRAPAATRDHRD